MGQGASSDPELMKASTTYFALIFKQIDKLEIVNAGKDVVHIFEKILSPRNLIQGTRYKDETETYKIKIHGMPFTLAAGSSVDFKISFLHILDQLYIELQMVPFVSSDLCLSTDTSTVFFEKEFENTSRGHYVCIAPSGHDCLDLINFPPNVQTQIISIIQSSWGTSDVTEKINQCFRVKMVGHPWSFGARGENATLIRTIITENRANNEILIAYKYVVNISMKGTCDMMYFQYDPTIIPDSSQSFIMYLSKRDRVRLMMLQIMLRVFKVMEHTIKRFISGDSRMMSFRIPPLNNSEQEKLYKSVIVVYENMKVLGGELVSSADVSSIVVKRNDKYVSYDTHSWYFLNIRGNSVWAY
ncbi:unnamed protein product [Lepeophtheirus salmonis]|uniref:(salmon louse) hypothetical protein n=1 Tax=Lepeophtheirus salmonis TaxID=72036 RepID=A0A7R8CLX1_LEPSM|nr:unnamed protein product [Lepeophtheirus salmonis]CAF2859535.1 unnamed protein product [Lepeophtheirus salmonis]